MDSIHRRYFAMVCGTYTREEPAGKPVFKVDFHDKHVDVHPDGSVAWHNQNERFNDKQKLRFDNFLIKFAGEEVVAIVGALNHAKKKLRKILMTNEIEFKDKKLEKEYRENIDELVKVMNKFLTRFFEEYRAYKRGEWE